MSLVIYWVATAPFLGPAAYFSALGWRDATREAKALKGRK